MRKILFFSLLFCTALFANSGATFGGLTGMFNIPLASALSNGEQIISLHKYQIKYTYGILNVLELGVRTSVEQVATFEDLGRNFQFNFKIRALNQKRSFVDFAGGGENTNYFLCLSKTINDFNNFEVSLGVGNGRFNGFFGGMSVRLDPITQLGLEYDGADYNAGFRLIISPKMKFDLYFKGISLMLQKPYLRDMINNHIVFGISYTEILMLDLGGIFK